MDKRTKILAGVLGVVVAYMFISGVAYPRWIEPWLNIDDRIAARREVLAELESLEARFLDARVAYRDMVARVGRFDATDVGNDVLARLNDLIESVGLQHCKRSPGRPRLDRKTGVTRLTFSVSGEGALASVIGFLQRAAELPHLVRVRNTSISPASTSARNRDANRKSFHTTMDILVVPKDRLVRVNPAALVQPASYRRYVDGRDYSRIWAGRPFTEYVKPPPPPPPPKPRPPPKPVEHVAVTPPPPPPPPAPKRWKDRNKMRLTMALLAADGTTPRDEFIIDNTARHETTYVAAGDAFDGGKLLLVHQYGAVVQRGDDVFFYRLGDPLDQDMKLSDAVEYPDLQLAGERLRLRTGAAAGDARDAAPGARDTARPTRAAANAAHGVPRPGTDGAAAKPGTNGRSKPASAAARRPTKPAKRRSTADKGRGKRPPADTRSRAAAARAARRAHRRGGPTAGAAHRSRAGTRKQVKKSPAKKPAGGKQD